MIIICLINCDVVLLPFLRSIDSRLIGLRVLKFPVCCAGFQHVQLWGEETLPMRGRLSAARCGWIDESTSYSQSPSSGLPALRQRTPHQLLLLWRGQELWPTAISHVWCGPHLLSDQLSGWSRRDQQRRGGGLHQRIYGPYRGGLLDWTAWLVGVV